MNGSRRAHYSTLADGVINSPKQNPFQAREKKRGWHTFRHTYSTTLIANGENVKIVQEGTRHETAVARWMFITRLQPLDGSRPKQLTAFKAERILAFNWSHDGRSLALVREVETSEVVLIEQVPK